MLQVFHKQAQVVLASEGSPFVRNTDVAKVDMDIAYVAMAIYLCCKYLFKMFSISLVCCKYFYLDVAYVAVAIYICCKRMFQMLHLL
jgi:hypothetical protein